MSTNAIVDTSSGQTAADHRPAVALIAGGQSNVVDVPCEICRRQIKAGQEAHVFHPTESGRPAIHHGGTCHRIDRRSCELSPEWSP